MNRLQQRAWTNLTVVVIILVFIAIRFVVTVDGLKEVEGGFVGLFTFGFVAGLCVLQAILSRKKQGEIRFDERDRLVNYRAILGTYIALWLLIFSALFSTLVSDNPVPVYVLRMLLGVIVIVLVLVYSILILVLYGRRGKGE